MYLAINDVIFFRTAEIRELNWHGNILTEVSYMDYHAILGDIVCS